MGHLSKPRNRVDFSEELRRGTACPEELVKATGKRKEECCLAKELVVYFFTLFTPISEHISSAPL